MPDIRTVFDKAALRGDWRLDPPALAEDDGLETAVIHSLFTDRRAEPDDRLPAEGSGRRGWWGDQLLPDEGDRYGSRLWLIDREKQLPEVLRRAEEYAREALRWMVDDGVAARVDVAAEIVRTGFLGLRIDILRADGRRVGLAHEIPWRTS